MPTRNPFDPMLDVLRGATEAQRDAARLRAAERGEQNRLAQQIEANRQLQEDRLQAEFAENMRRRLDTQRTALVDAITYMDEDDPRLPGIQDALAEVERQLQAQRPALDVTVPQPFEREVRGPAAPPLEVRDARGLHPTQQVPTRQITMEPRATIRGEEQVPLSQVAATAAGIARRGEVAEERAAEQFAHELEVALRGIDFDNTVLLAEMQHQFNIDLQGLDHEAQVALQQIINKAQADLQAGRLAHDVQQQARQIAADFIRQGREHGFLTDQQARQLDHDDQLQRWIQQHITNRQRDILDAQQNQERYKALTERADDYISEILRTDPEEFPVLRNFHMSRLINIVEEIKALPGDFEFYVPVDILENLADPRLVRLFDAQVDKAEQEAIRAEAEVERITAETDELRLRLAQGTVDRHEATGDFVGRLIGLFRSRERFDEYVATLSDDELVLLGVSREQIAMLADEYDTFREQGEARELFELLIQAPVVKLNPDGTLNVNHPEVIAFFSHLEQLASVVFDDWEFARVWTDGYRSALVQEWIDKADGRHSTRAETYRLRMTGDLAAAQAIAAVAEGDGTMAVELFDRTMTYAQRYMDRIKIEYDHCWRNPTAAEAEFHGGNRWDCEPEALRNLHDDLLHAQTIMDMAFAELWGADVNTFSRARAIQEFEEAVDSRLSIFDQIYGPALADLDLPREVIEAMQEEFLADPHGFDLKPDDLFTIERGDQRLQVYLDADHRAFWNRMRNWRQTLFNDPHALETAFNSVEQTLNTLARRLHDGHDISDDKYLEIAEELAESSWFLGWPGHIDAEIELFPDVYLQLGQRRRWVLNTAERLRSEVERRAEMALYTSDFHEDLERLEERTREDQEREREESGLTPDGKVVRLKPGQHQKVNSRGQAMRTRDANSDIAGSQFELGYRGAVNDNVHAATGTNLGPSQVAFMTFNIDAIPQQNITVEDFMRSLRIHESGEDYQSDHTIGDGSRILGAYQFKEQTWNDWVARAMRNRGPDGQPIFEQSPTLIQAPDGTIPAVFHGGETEKAKSRHNQDIVAEFKIRYLLKEKQMERQRLGLGNHHNYADVALAWYSGPNNRWGIYEGIRDRPEEFQTRFRLDQAENRNNNDEPHRNYYIGDILTRAYQLSQQRQAGAPDN